MLVHSFVSFLEKKGLLFYTETSTNKMQLDQMSFCSCWLWRQPETYNLNTAVYFIAAVKHNVDRKPPNWSPNITWSYYITLFFEPVTFMLWPLCFVLPPPPGCAHYHVCGKARCFTGLCHTCLHVPTRTPSTLSKTTITALLLLV